MDATLLPPSPPTSARPSHDELEGDTLIASSPVSQGYDKGGSSADEVDANEDTMVVDDGTYMNQDKKVNVDEERRRRIKQGSRAARRWLVRGCCISFPETRHAWIRADPAHRLD